MNSREEILTLWQAQEADVRSRLAPPGVATLAQLKELSGIEFLQHIWEGKLPSLHIGETMEFIPLEGSQAVSCFRVRPAESITTRLAAFMAAISAHYSTPHSGAQCTQCFPRGSGTPHWN